MIFIGGISSGSKRIDYLKTVVCDVCGGYGRFEIYMTYMYFSFFFIPLFKWNKRYYVKMSCCDTVYELNQDTGKRLLRGEETDIRDHDLTLLKEGSRKVTWSRKKQCEACGYEAEEEFDYCPKCGRKF